MHTLDYSTFIPHHFDACRADFEGNGDIGRYVFIPGSNSRAEEIAGKHFKNLQVKNSSRGHNLYLGDLEYHGKIIKVAAISTGMGAPSVDVIVSELILLGAKRFLRVGTAGGMQPHIKVGDVVFGTAGVRDEATSVNYVPLAFPSIASIDMLVEAQLLKYEFDYTVHLGMVHTKDSLYVREFSRGPSSEESIKFMQKLKAYGVIASEMECSHLYVLSQVYSQEFRYEIKSGCVLGIIGNEEVQFVDKDTATATVNRTINFSISLIKKLAFKELYGK